MSLAELPELIGFFSYAREDDIGSGGRLTRLRERIHEELRSQLGRRRGNFKVWQDKVAIAEGTLWSDEIRTAIDQSVFFVPIITPTALKSEYCVAEFEHFLAREKQLGRNDLVFPILYIRVPELENESQWRQSPVLKIVGERQYLNWLDYRHLDMDSKEVGVAIERFCRSIHDALNRSWLSPEEQQKQTEEARRLKDERDAQWRREQEEDTQRQKNAEAQRLEDERQRAQRIKAQPETTEGATAEKIKSAEAVKSLDERRKLEERLKRGRNLIFKFSATIVALAASCYIIYQFIAGLSIFSTWGFIGWAAIIVGSIIAVFLLLLILVGGLPDIREVKAQLAQLGRSELK